MNRSVVSYQKNRYGSQIAAGAFSQYRRLCRLLIILYALCGLFFSGGVMATEEPDYKVIEKSGKLELRAYAPRIIAQTVVSGSMDQATTEGFKVIADYIFGNNTVSDGGSQNISMTVPVTLGSQSEKISMTVPVSMEQTDGQWRVDFFMPSEYTMDSLPVPNNAAVVLREIPAANYAAIRYSGLTGEIKTAKKTAELLAWLEGKGLTPTGEPVLARYNSPVSLPFLRRNEVIVPYK